MKAYIMETVYTALCNVTCSKNYFHNVNFHETRCCCVFWTSKPCLLRDAMHKCGLCCHAVSVCPSVTFVDHVKTNKHIFEIFSPSGSDTILVFPYQTGCRYSDGNPPNGGSNTRGYEKLPIFFTNISLYLRNGYT